MPYVEKWDGPVLYRQYSGVITGKEMMDANLALFGTANFDSLRVFVSDFSGIEKFQVEVESFRDELAMHAHITEAGAKTNSRVKLAVIATDETARALATLYKEALKSLSIPWKVELFTELTAALEWTKKATIQYS